VNVCVRMYVSMCVCMYVCVYVSVNVCVNVYGTLSQIMIQGLYIVYHDLYLSLCTSFALSHHNILTLGRPTLTYIPQIPHISGHFCFVSTSCSPWVHQDSGMPGLVPHLSSMSLHTTAHTII